MVPGICRSRVPLGPLTEIVRPTTVTSTPAGTVMGALPIRDIVSSPDVAEDLAADVALARLAVGHEAMGGGQDSHAEATEHARHGVGAAVDPQARRRDATQAGDRAVTIGRVLELDGQDLADAAGRRAGLEAADVALLLEDFGEAHLLLRRGHAHLVVTRTTSSDRGSRRRVRARAGTDGRDRTCDRRNVPGRSDGNGCSHEP